MKMAQIEKSKKKKKKSNHPTIQLRQSQAPISSPLQIKNSITFCTFGAFLRKETGWDQRLKGQNQNLPYPITEPFMEPLILVC